MQQAPKPPLEEQGRAGARRKAKKARKSPSEENLAGAISQRAV